MEQNETVEPRVESTQQDLVANIQKRLPELKSKPDEKKLIFNQYCEDFEINPERFEDEPIDQRMVLTRWYEPDPITGYNIDCSYPRRNSRMDFFSPPTSPRNP